jgi:uncharacterized membrane protein
MLDLLQIIGVLLRLFAFGVLAITSAVVAYVLLLMVVPQKKLNRARPATQGLGYLDLFRAPSKRCDMSS